MREALFLLSLAGAAGLLQGCVPVLIGAGGAMAFTTLEDRRTTGIQIDDEGIELRASSRIGERYADVVHVNATSYNRTVLLTGEVPDARTREDVEKITRAVPGVRGVTNELEIAGVSSLGARTNDSYVTSKVKASFLDTAKFSPVHVKVVTENGVVYLLGIVMDEEANQAAELARTVAGVRKVVKIFEYCKATDEICRPRPKEPADPKKPKPAA
jgi:osmotically-inducible protein OsmY